MSPELSIPAVVLLAGPDAAALGALQPAAEVLQSFGIGTETRVIWDDASMATLPDGLCAMIVASPDAVLPAMLAAHTDLPVIRVPVATGDRNGLALFNDDHKTLPASPVHGVFATMAIGEPGAKNAALFVISTLAHRDERLRAAWGGFRARQTEAVLQHPPLILEN